MEGVAFAAVILLLSVPVLLLATAFGSLYLAWRRGTLSERLYYVVANPRLRGRVIALFGATMVTYLTAAAVGILSVAGWLDPEMSGTVSLLVFLLGSVTFLSATRLGLNPAPLRESERSVLAGPISMYALRATGPSEGSSDHGFDRPEGIAAESGLEEFGPIPPLIGSSLPGIPAATDLDRPRAD